MQEIIVYDFRNTLEAILDILSEYSALKSNIKASHFEHIFSHYLAILSSLKSSSDLLRCVFYKNAFFHQKMCSLRDGNYNVSHKVLPDVLTLGMSLSAPAMM